MSDKLTPEQIAEIQDELRVLKTKSATWGGLGIADTTNAIIDIAGLLSHVAALDAELAAARAENARLADDIKALEGHEWVCQHCPDETRWLRDMPPYTIYVKGNSPIPGRTLEEALALARKFMDMDWRPFSGCQ